MKNLTSALAIIFTAMIFISCSKEKKPEFTDENTGQNTPREMKNDEPKSEVKQENTEDTSNTKTNTNQQNTKSRNFEIGKPEAVITPMEAGNYNGRTVTVKGFVADVYQSEKVAYLNFVEKFPKNPFTAVIFASKFSDFPDIIKYKNKDVEVTGRVSMYREKAQIILNSPKQIVVK
jgi:DNA/RNA endonuclease YhcR with UshA esterase domain